MPSALNPPPSLADVQSRQQAAPPPLQRSSSSASHDSHSSGSSHSSHSSYAERHPDRVPPKAVSPDRPFISVLGVLALVLFYNSAGLWLFVKGFLLTRVELQGINQCHKPAVASWTPPRAPPAYDKAHLLDWSLSLDPESGSGECTLPPTHSKAILIVIDALRYDFIAPIPPLSSDSQHGWRPDPYYHSKITLPAELTAMSAQNSFLAHFAADAPTTTLQRLKGLTTGTLPTFIEAGANFGGMGKVHEDNWLSQFRAKSLRQQSGNEQGNAGLVFAGDDTWATVFPNVFDQGKVWSYDSFNVEDLDTVDAGVESSLLPFLQKHHPNRTAGLHDEGSWKLLIGHTLGVDHVGHRFGASHPKMEIKMQEMQQFLLNITNAVDDNTLVVLLGDHGMDERGDHGGDGELEVGAALWMWSRSGFGPFTKANAAAAVGASSLVDYLTSSEAEEMVPSYLPFSPLPSPPFDPRGHRSVPQIDLVPSLSLLLGLPVPFNSLGSVIPELFPSTDRLLRALRITSFQIKTYLDKYSAESSDLAAFSSELETLWLKAVEADAKHSSAFHSSSKDLAHIRRQAAQAYAHFNRASLTRARSVWAQFEMTRIYLGLIILGLGLVSTWVLWSGARNGLRGLFPPPKETSPSELEAEADDEAPAQASTSEAEARLSANMEEHGQVVYKSSAIPAFLGGSIGLIGFLVSKVVPAQFKSSLTLLDMLLFGAALGAQVGLVAPHIQNTYAKVGFEVNTPNTTKALQGLGVFVMIIHAGLFASNSFTVWEDRIVLALLGVILLARFAMGLGAPTQRMKIRMPIMALLALVLIRLASIPRVCREEQAPYCKPTFYAASSANAAASDSTHSSSESSATATSGGAALNSPYVIAVSYLFAYFLPSLLGRALDSSKSFVGIAPVFFNWVLRPTLLVGSGYWLLDWALPLPSIAESGWKPTLEWLKNWIAKIDIVFLFVPALVFWVFAPLCLELRQEAITAQDAGSSTVTPEDAKDGKPKQRVSIMGYANSLGSSYLLLLCIVLSGLWITTQPAGQLAFGACFLAGILNAELGDSERDVLILHRQRIADSERGVKEQTKPSSNNKKQPPEKMSALERAAEAASSVPTDSAAEGNGTVSNNSTRVFVSFSEMATVVLLGYIAFFGTGHQATLASIQWRTAFIGFPTVTYPWSPMLVASNSFGHLFVLPTLLVPLSVCWNYAPRPRSTAAPGSKERLQAKMHLPSQLLFALLTVILYNQVLLLSISSLSALVFKRHLMLFKIWTPRFMLATVGFFITSFTAILATLATWQVANKVNRIFGTEFQ